MVAQGFDVLQLDELEHLEDGGVQQVVAVVVGDEGVHHRHEQVALDYVAVVEFVLEIDNFPHESDSAQLQECVPRFNQHQYSPQQI